MERKDRHPDSSLTLQLCYGRVKQTTKGVVNVTECICTLCLCCCTLCVAPSAFFCVHVLWSFTCYVLWFRSHEKTWRQRKKKREGITTASCMYCQKEEIKSGTAGSGLFVVSYFQPDTSMSPFTLSMQNGYSKSDIEQTTWTADTKQTTQRVNLC